MKCPVCGSPTDVQYTRPKDIVHIKRRSRVCQNPNCAAKIITDEKVVDVKKCLPVSSREEILEETSDST